ncbi:hypothetical protein V502_10502 [Pseudogymnoascus sp. VKM F-4520 (FW-2644)]|nr:hypothetical protein V502_10502 [Pseudogymnoascus sp. VKM F-4520 (FW-2644)]
MRSAPALASALLFAIVPLTSAAVQTCYGFDGKSWANNVQCPGSQACCGEQGICLPNKLCNSKKDGTGEIIRGPCAAKQYDTAECAEIYEIANKFPRVTICEDDGKYCCDNDKKCCDEGRGVVLNGAGKVVGKAISSTSDSPPSTLSTSTGPPQSTTSDQPFSTSDPSPLDPSTTSSKTSTPSAASETTAPSQATSSSEPTAAGGLATGAKIGIGVAVPVAVLGAAALGAFLWFRRRRVYPAGAGNKDGYKPSPQAQELGATESPQELQAFPKEQNNIPIELPADEAQGMKAAKVDYKPHVRGE